MEGNWNGPRLSQRDIKDLDKASQALAAAHETVARAKPHWYASVSNAIITANDVIVRIQERGARALARHVEKHGLPGHQAASEPPDVDDPPSSSRKIDPEEP